MIWVDYIIVGIIAFSALISILRGFIREVLSLVAWVAAIVFARLGMEPVAELLGDRIPSHSVRLGIAFIVLFIGTLLAVGLLNFVVGKFIARTGLTAADRTLGVVFGIARGVLVVAVLVLLAGTTPFPKDSWWQASQLLPYFQELAVWMRSQLPQEIAKYVSYS